ncbi:MAG: hypothetical protein JRI68_00680 [Deltaproteobacteria bacterium]|nr:hypothetical protein [Deltaproteobacteria bacterium]
MGNTGRARSNRGLALALVAATGGWLGCQPEASTQTTSSPLSPSAEAPTATVTADASAGPPSATTSPHAGTWTGEYATAKGKVNVPKGVDYSTWKKDEGKERSGKGTLELTVAADGAVTGKGTGALGGLTVAGVVDDGWLRTGLTPTDPEGPNAMTGVLIGEVKGSKIVGWLRMASHDGSLVREAKVTLAPRR